VRQFHLGQEYVQQAQYERAVECFDQSIRSNPKCYDAIFARGQAYEKMGDFRQAVLDFGRVRRDRPTAEAYACEGFCLSKLGFYQQAIPSYRTALGQGFRSASILNNLGFSYLQLNRPDVAEEYFNKAIALDERLEAAHLNLLAAVLMREAKSRPLPESALVHCEKALEVCPPSSDLFFSAGGIYSLAARDNPGFKRQAIACLKKAVAHGYSPKAFQSVSIFTALGDDEEFRELLHTAPGPKASVRVAHVLDPLQ
jgi:tetratricopeptide (TPR) repeat protein